MEIQDAYLDGAMTYSEYERRSEATRDSYYGGIYGMTEESQRPYGWRDR
jgi:hypothetical protein